MMSLPLIYVMSQAMLVSGAPVQALYAQLDSTNHAAESARGGINILSLPLGPAPPRSIPL
jgi:hypothetical protein